MWMPKRTALRFELTESAKSALETLSDRHGMMQYAVMTRLIEWFVDQDEAIQFAVLAATPAELRVDIAKMLLGRRDGTNGRR
jgi:hypothetical protein